jgi:hypothetical protein
MMNVCFSSDTREKAPFWCNFHSMLQLLISTFFLFSFSLCFDSKYCYSIGFLSMGKGQSNRIRKYLLGVQYANDLYGSRKCLNWMIKRNVSVVSWISKLSLPVTASKHLLFYFLWQNICLLAVQDENENKHT